MKKTMCGTLLLLSLSAVPMQANAWVATETTQILNNIQLVMQYANQVQQLQNQTQMLQRTLQDAVKNPEVLLRDPQGTMNRLASAVEQGEALGMNSNRIANKFQQTYGTTGGDYSKAYANWSKTTKDSIRSALSAVGVNQAALTDEAPQIQKLALLAKNSDGASQAAQTGNEIALSLVDQLQKLRSLQMAQMQAQNAQAMQMQQQGEADNLAMKKFMNPSKLNVSPDFIKNATK